MSELPFYLAAFVVVLGVLVVVHEFGHFAVARLCGVKVLRFSLGFGPVVWRRCFGRDRTEWAIGLVPLGGYVKMLNEREGEVAAEELPRAFNRQSVGRRSLIVVAGPLANFLLAILLYWVVFLHGSNELLPILGTPPTGSPAAAAGVGNGDQVTAVDGEPVRTWEDFRWLLLQKAIDRPDADLAVITAGHEIVSRHLSLQAAGENGWEGDALERLGIGFYQPDLPPVLGQIVEGGPARRAGLQAGDRVTAVEGRRIASWHDFVTAIRKAPGRRLHVDVERQRRALAVDVVPETVSARGLVFGRIGVAVAETGLPQRELQVFVSYGPFEAGRRALAETWGKSVFTLVMMGKMLTGEVSWKNISGPVTIADYAGQSARLGLTYYLEFMALVSISLGVLNLLPIPVLDGGHLLYHMLEVVRRRPLSERFLETSQRIGLSILFVLMAFAFFNDLNRLFFG